MKTVLSPNAAAALTVCALAGATPVAAQTPPSAIPAPNIQRVTLSSIYDHPLLQKKITLSLQDADINKAVEELAKAAGVSLVVERAPTLQAKPVTLALSDAKLGDVLDVLGRSYGYRWRRRGEVFLLTLSPTGEAPEKDGGEMAKDIYENVLTPEQRAQVDRDGFLEGKDLTPGQKGVLAAYLREMFNALQSRTVDVGRLTLSRTEGNMQFGISASNGDGEKPKQP
jgi:hypothetical protein